MLIRDQVSTFIVRVSGESMLGAGISDGDELIVDSSVQPRNVHVVIAVIDGEITVKCLSTGPDGAVLEAENSDYPDLRVAERSDFRISGVATTCLHPLNTDSPGPSQRGEYIAKADVNSFYVSCERTFDPKLEAQLPFHSPANRMSRTMVHYGSRGGSSIPVSLSSSTEESGVPERIEPYLK